MSGAQCDITFRNTFGLMIILTAVMVCMYMVYSNDQRTVTIRYKVSGDINMEALPRNVSNVNYGESRFKHHRKTTELLVSTTVTTPLEDSCGPRHYSTQSYIPEEKSVQEWLERRQSILENTDVRKVALYAYMRGGSSFLGRLFDNNPEAIYLYEPLCATYRHVLWTVYPRSLHMAMNRDGSVKGVPDNEKNSISFYTDATFNCDFYNSPMPFLDHMHMNKSKVTRPFYSCVRKHAPPHHRSCREQRGALSPNSPLKRLHLPADKSYRMFYDYLKTGKTKKKDYLMREHTLCNVELMWNIRPCVQDLVKRCSRKRIRAAKFIRMKSDVVESVLQKSPDVFFIFYVRDPRSIVLSRRVKNYLSRVAGNRIVNEARLLCRRMLHDGKIIKALAKKYPNAILHFRYEDLIYEPVATVAKVYAHFSDKPPDSVIAGIEAEGLKMSSFVVRENVTTAEGYPRTYSLPANHKEMIVLRKMDTFCAETYKEFGYEKMQ